ncbi:Endoribonuclease L-PSP/chorismate mutase-like protein [Aspergillus multicolor]|uniref:RidA family protein n=1 Tax=Aspergillus multicolor TaxID=41759 RepID=UPI003CCD1EBF
MFTRTALVTARSSLIAGHLHSPVAASVRTARETMGSNLQAPAKRSVSSSPSPISVIHTEKTYAPFAHYSQAIRVAPSCSTVYLSGQIPAHTNGTLIQGSMAEKTAVIINNTKIILEEVGSGLGNVVKVVVYLRDARTMPEFAKVYDAAFPHKPARSMVEVSALPAGVDVQVDFVAVGEP